MLVQHIEDVSTEHVFMDAAEFQSTVRAQSLHLPRLQPLPLLCGIHGWETFEEWPRQ